MNLNASTRILICLSLSLSFMVIASTALSAKQYRSHRPKLTSEELAELAKVREVRAWLRDCEKAISRKASKRTSCKHYPNVKQPPLRPNSGSTGTGVIGVLPIHLGHTEELYDSEKPVSIVFSLSWSGNITAVEIHKSSGDQSADDKALKVLKSVERFKTPPGFMAYNTKVIVQFNKSISCSLLRPFKYKVPRSVGNRWRKKPEIREITR